VKFESLSFRQVAVGIPILALLNWGIFQFGILPKMPEQERKGIYAGWMSTPYPYVISLAFVCAAIWFAFSYRGRSSTHGRRIAAFGMALATVCGMLLMLVIRSTWHI